MSSGLTTFATGLSLKVISESRMHPCNLRKGLGNLPSFVRVNAVTHNATPYNLCHMETCVIRSACSVNTRDKFVCCLHGPSTNKSRPQVKGPSNSKAVTVVRQHSCRGLQAHHYFFQMQPEPDTCVWGDSHPPPPSHSNRPRRLSPKTSRMGCGAVFPACPGMILRNSDV